MSRVGRAGSLALAVAAALVVLPGCAVWRSVGEATRFTARGSAVELREGGDAGAGAEGPSLIVVAIDGVDRDLLYGLLRGGELPEIAALVGLPATGGGAAHLEPSLLATLPSSTAVAWATAFTGAPPAEHGVVGNEIFLREERRMAAPVPSSIQDPSDVLATFTEGLVNDLLLVPTVYERMRAREPGLRVWVAMHSVFRGADVLLMPDRVALLDAFRVTVQEKLRAQISDEEASRVFEELDRDIVRSVRDHLEDEGGRAPDVLTVYLPGTDLYAHSAGEGPDAGRRDYLRRVVDPLIGELAADLRERGALRDRWVVVTSDHGHTQVVHEDHYSLGVDDSGEPADVLHRAGFRVRPFQLETADDADYDAVLAYQGGLAYVYLADRSSCLEAGQRCDWSAPPRLDEDVLAAADAFHRTSTEGLHASQLVDSLEMILVRRPCAQRGCTPFRVYVGDGRLEDLESHLAANPRPHWPGFEARLRALAAGPAAARVGDLVLIARAGDERPLEERRYFAPPYRSYHGSPGEKDARIPLIVSHPGRSGEQVRARVARALGGSAGQDGVARVLLDLVGEGGAGRYAAP